ncbi:riboflavin synthase [bacterium]|nr:riboflavin synthase [bacterium]
MFTGIIEEIGKITTITDKNIIIDASEVLQDAKIGDSIAVNGVCLTVTNIENQSFSADISPETQKVTTFCKLKSGDRVNLERALPANGRFGGHIVTGHIDSIGEIKSISNAGNFYNIVLKLDKDNSKYVVKKGSITINGVSLTVADESMDTITVAVIPHTFQNTTFKYLKNGDKVNIETDIISKYVEKFLSTRDNRTGIDMEFLIKNGF